MNICICFKVDACFHFSSISRSLIARSYDKNMFTILYSYQQCMKFQFSISLPSLVLSALFVCFSHSSRYLIVILISHSLMTNDVQLNLSPACDVCSVVNCLFKSFPFFKIQPFVVLLFKFKNFYFFHPHLSHLCSLPPPPSPPT